MLRLPTPMSEQVLDNQTPTPDETHQPLVSQGLLLSGILAIVLTTAIGYLQLSALKVFWISAGLTALVGFGSVPLLRQLKAGQIIRAEGPQSHLSKAGTPTMGGIYFIPVGVALALVVTGWDPTVIAASVLTLAYGFVGWLDDWHVIREQSNKGLSPQQKLLLQIFITAAFCGWLAWSGVDWSVVIPGFGLLPISWGFWPLAGFVLVGTNNAVNLTDGMDGLAGGVVALILAGLAAIVAPTDPALAVFGFALSGSCLGFLAQNRNPARVFMGDTGSLALGGALAAVALLGNCLWALAVMGLILIVEALSVILQVSYFKYTKRRTGEGQRILRMSPLHHHLELGGWSEIRVVSTFYIITGILACFSWWIVTHLL